MGFDHIFWRKKAKKFVDNNFSVLRSFSMKVENCKRPEQGSAFGLNRTFPAHYISKVIENFEFLCFFEVTKESQQRSE